ncbi:MAG: glutamate formimidoyltransferase [Chloroflexi bacterium]|nr:glutamate formimidoyltransferase [Chloroflexota bacterium]
MTDDSACLVECVPNFSEGRRTEVVDALAGSVEESPAVTLLDRTADRDHNRSVLTFAGSADAVFDAMVAAMAIAVERIDLRSHEGQHPRIGAVDVVPFVPIGATSMEDCIDLAARFGAEAAERFDVPVYLYARAARRSERAVLADIRRPQFEGLGTLIGDPLWQPDFGPARLHPSAGATAVGARPFLIAYNINLESNDQGLAKRIAHRVRERSGGLPRVQALGLYLADQGCAQVSMNLLDFTITPLWQVWQAVTGLAHSEGIDARESELIGLAPLRALLDVADDAGVAPGGAPEVRIKEAARLLKIRDFEPTMALELRLQRTA